MMGLKASRNPWSETPGGVHLDELQLHPPLVVSVLREKEELNERF